MSKKFRIYKPYLNASLDLGFFSFQTELMHRSYEMYAYNYIRIHWRLFRWSGSFMLYKPGEDFKNSNKELILKELEFVFA